MKFPLITAALSTTFFLSSLPVTEARAYYRYKDRPSCSDLGLCRRGGRDAWLSDSHGLSSLSRSANMLDNVMTELFRVPISFNTLYEQSQRHLTDTMSRSSVRYDVTDSDEKMELTLDLPGIHAKDISIELLQGGNSLNISGSRRFKQQGKIVTSQFEQIFTIDDEVIDVDTIEANLSEGVLVISALKKHPQTLSSERKIPIGTAKRDAINIKGGAETKLDHVADETRTETDISNDTRAGVEVVDDDLEISPEEDI